MKYLLVIGDGMADNPVPELGGKTPLEYADIPYIDALAAKGTVGSVRNCPQGLPPGSDTAILSILGHDPRRCYTGRSPLEAAATGIVLSPGAVSYRCNMIALEDGDQPFAEKKILSHSGGSIDGEESIALITYLLEQPAFQAAAQTAGMTIHPAPSFRHIAVQAGTDITGIQLIPPHDHLGEVIGPLLPSGCPNAAALKELMALANQLLDHHPINEARRTAGKLPANGIWFWAEGTGVALESFWEKYHKKGLVISAVPLCHGIARLSGLDIIQVEGATGELDTNYENKAAATLTALCGKEYDFVALHIEASDECTHNGDLKGKLQAIEWLDTRTLRPICEALKQKGIDYRLLFLSDHKTLTATRGHDGDPVPYLLYDSRIDTGRGLPMTEKSGEQGPYLPDGASSLMPLLFEQ
ncbi:MAG: 2,3-bisphosphoglycerate-independent phosphoglycerate mutase [Oscillospiraceae bacterium]|nr:2,3-bisphosphoglycerate-independent phosphoglycerate mutase [Oscillospiraceae bacterium]